MGRAGRFGRCGGQEESLFLTWEAMWVSQEVETSCGQSVCEMLVGHAVEMPDGQLCRKDWATLRVLGQK